MKAGAVRWALLAVVLAAAPAVHTVGAETLEEAWARALANDRGLAAARSQAEAAGLEADAARAQRWPTLAVGGGFTWLDESPAFDFSFTGLPLVPPPLFAATTSRRPRRRCRCRSSREGGSPPGSPPRRPAAGARARRRSAPSRT